MALEKCLEKVGLEIVAYMLGMKIVVVSRMEYSRSELEEAVHHNPVHEVVLVEGLESCSSGAVAVAELAAVVAEAQEWANFVVDRQMSRT